MAGVTITLPPDYWKTLSLGKPDLEFISNYLFEKETPLAAKEIVPILIEERIQEARDSLAVQQQAAGRIYLPKDHYKLGEDLVFPALDMSKGKVTGIREGFNPAVGEFDVIEVELEEGKKRLFAAGVADHQLNQPPTLAADDPSVNPENILKTYGSSLEQQLTKALGLDRDLVRIAGRWFPRALLVDVNEGHLNLAEAVLDEANGKPVPTATLIEQIELPGNINPKLVEFSMNYALQEDGRFDEVGPAGEVLWCLKRLEPQDVQQIPARLHYNPIEYDRAILNHGMLALEAEIDDELGENDPPAEVVDEVLISLTYPHWRSGTLPVSARVRGLFPTAYESPRVRFSLLDGQSNTEIPAWVVRQNRYVSGLTEFYRKYGLTPGSLVAIRKGKKPGQVGIEAKTHRPIRDWIRTVLVGSDGGVVFAMLKQNITSDFNERMVIAVPDPEGVDQASDQILKQHLPFDRLVNDILRELIKLNVQGHVHAQEMYSALNIVRRCPPAPLMALLANGPAYKHVGDLHFRLTDVDGGNA